MLTDADKITHNLCDDVRRSNFHIVKFTKVFICKQWWNIKIFDRTQNNDELIIYFGVSDTNSYQPLVKNKDPHHLYRDRTVVVES
jgi:hypothetical protein